MATQLVSTTHSYPYLAVSLIISILLCFTASLQAQSPATNIDNTITSGDFHRLQMEYGKNKQIPTQYATQILLALSHFPALKNTKIIFSVKQAHSPLSSRPLNGSLFKSTQDRVYIVTISDSSTSLLSPILFHRLPFHAQVGVMGHELSHLVDFSSKTFLQLLAIGVQHISPKFIDRFEYGTDSICIAHGLGVELLSWSVFVRNAMHVTIWRGADDPLPGINKHERYMNPQTIIEYLQRSGQDVNSEFIQNLIR